MLKLFPPRAKNPSWQIRGRHAGRRIDQSTRARTREEAERALLALQEKLDAGDGLVWRQIPGFSRYEISDNGKIRRLPALLKQTRHRSGHLAVTLYSDDGKPWRAGVHHFVARAFLGDPPLGKSYACHKNGIADENGSYNLYWGSAADNAADAVRHASWRPMGGIRGNNATEKKLSRREIREKAFRPNWLEENGNGSRARPW